MTETEWLSSDLAEAMVDCLCTQFGAARSKAGHRKLRLLACACCRLVWETEADYVGERTVLNACDRELVVVSENFADGRATTQDLEAARQRCLDDPGHNYGAVLTAEPQLGQAAVRSIMAMVSLSGPSDGGYLRDWRTRALSSLV